MIRARCCICEGEKARLIKTENSWDIVQCEACGHVYLYPIPDEAFLKKHYQSYLSFGKDQIEQWRFMMSGIFARSLAIIGKFYNRQSGKLLDIGCGYGFFLEMAGEKGWDAYGLDLCQAAVGYANSRGLKAEGSGLFERAYKDEEFDVVTMFYVLEHLPNPARYLQEISRILKPKGILFLRVPHTTPLAKALGALSIPNKLYDAPSHLSDFSPETLKLILTKSGFCNIHTFIGGMTYPRPFYKMLISVISGCLAEFLYTVSFKKFLLPGVSKSTIARKQ